MSYHVKRDKFFYGVLFNTSVNKSYDCRSLYFGRRPVNTVIRLNRNFPFSNTYLKF